MTSELVTTPVDAAEVCLGDLSQVDLAGIAAGGLEAMVRRLARMEAMLAAFKLRILAEAERSRAAVASGKANVGQWAAAATHADPAVTSRHARLAVGLEERAATQEALTAGELSVEHAEVIVRATAQLPASATAVQRALVEQTLIVEAGSLSPQLLRRRARRALAAIEPDPAAVDAQENSLVVDEETAAWAKTRLTMHDNDDGTVSGHFTVPTLQGHLLRKVLQTISAPRRGRLGASRAQVGDNVGLRKDWDRARGEAFCELLEKLPVDHLSPKTAATIVVTMTEESLRGSMKVAGLDTGAEISAGEARRLLCNAGVIPAVLGGRSVPLDLGRSSRLFSEAQRVAVGLTYQTCAAEGCDRPLAWAELHHRDPWSVGGETNLEDAVPVCHFHHRRIHDPHYGHEYRPHGVRFYPRP
ncbi:MAG: DUF222 domain-containing protein [Propionibacteriales bacterium]|nr:DUF222 domain-containing protein [Propionibacteriales bacterium]